MGACVHDVDQGTAARGDRLVEPVAGGAWPGLRRAAAPGNDDDGQQDEHQSAHRSPTPLATRGFPQASDAARSSACSRVRSPSIRTIVPPSSMIKVLVARRSVSSLGLPAASSKTKTCGCPEIHQPSWPFTVTGSMVAPCPTVLPKKF